MVCRSLLFQCGTSLLRCKRSAISLAILACLSGMCANLSALRALGVDGRRRGDAFHCDLLNKPTIPTSFQLSSLVTNIYRLSLTPDRRLAAAPHILFRDMDMHLSISDRPMCPTCKHRMGLARISPGQRGFEERTFECGTCHQLEKVSLPVDPLNTNGVGWTASDSKPTL